jgi:hypothetical protein
MKVDIFALWHLVTMSLFLIEYLKKGTIFKWTMGSKAIPLISQGRPSMTLVINNKMKRFLRSQSSVLKILKGPMSIFSWNKNPTNKWSSQICKHLSWGWMELTCSNKGFASNVEKCKCLLVLDIQSKSIMQRLIFFLKLYT